MNGNLTNKFSLIALAITTLMLTACASSTSVQPAAETDNSPAQIEIEPWDGDGMEIPLDGSSMEAWNRSLARVKAHTTPAKYTTLLDSIEYLKLYDLSARGNMNRLIENLDGLTGYQVVQRINWRTPAPGKGPAEKGAADAKIIDS